MKELLIKRLEKQIEDTKLDILLIEYQIKFYQSKGKTEIQNGYNMLGERKRELKWRKEILKFIKTNEQREEGNCDPKTNHN